MQYAVRIYNHDFSSNLTTIFYGQDMYDFSYFSELSKPGGAQFTINTRNVKCTPANLKMYNKVIIEKDGVGVFIGYIEQLEVRVNTLDVSIVGMLGFFKKRQYSGTFQTALGDTLQGAFFEILTQINSGNPTGISAGVTNVSDPIRDVQFKRSTVIDAWTKLTNMGGGEFEIDTDRNLNFKYTLGTDNSDSVTLQYNINQINSSNLREFKVDVDGKNMANSVVGIRNGGSIYQGNNLASIALFGRLGASINYSQTNSSDDLTREVDNYVVNHKDEFYSPSLVVDESKIDPDTLQLGDTVYVRLNNGFIEIEEAERIIKRTVSVTDNLTEEVKLRFMPASVNLLPSSFAEDIVTLGNRVRLLEQEI